MNSMPKWIDYSDAEMENNNLIQTKYKYDIKINDIGLYSNKYENTSIFVSKPTTINSIIHNIKLDTDDYIPEGTSIEYYISLAETPTIDDWIPIAANDNKDVKNEKLFFNKYGQAILRFGGTISNIVIKEDGDIIDDSRIVVEKNNKNQNVIYIDNINAANIYTADYQIENTLVEVLLKDLIIKQIVEEFDKLDDDNKVSLSHKVLTKWESGNIKDIEVVIDSADGLPGFIDSKEGTDVEICKFTRIMESGADYLYPGGNIDHKKENETRFPQLKNCSKRGRESFTFQPFNPYLKSEYDINNMESHYPYIEYLFTNSKVYFADNKHLFGGASDIKFKIRYDYVDTPIRFKAILRNNTSNIDITPVLNSYKITLI